MKETAVIKTENLGKVFGKLTVVDGLNLDIRPGEIYGLVGPDGAGKTTLIRILTAIMEPTSGNAWVAGHSVLSEGERIKEKIGYMPQRFGLYEDLTVMENIIFYADLFNVHKKKRPERIERLLGFSNLTPFKGRLAGKLSGGMKQKLGLACALIHTPEILFLDEPTNGVDPVSRRDFWRILYDLLSQGITIFVSTAYLDEAERCTRVGLIHEGRLLVENDPGTVKKSFRYPMVAIWTDNPRRTLEVIRKITGVLSASIYGEQIHAAIESTELIASISYQLQVEGMTTKGYREIVPSLEDVFIMEVSPR